MIKRSYFFSAQIDHGDKTGSHFFTCFTLSVKSFFPNDGEVLNEAVDEAQKQFEKSNPDKTGGYPKVLAFNRI